MSRSSIISCCSPISSKTLFILTLLVLIIATTTTVSGRKPAGTSGSRNTFREQQRPTVVPHSSNVTSSELDADFEDAPSSSHCPTCTGARDEVRQMSLDLIKEQILTKLGMNAQHMPNVTGLAIPRIPPLTHLADLYGAQSDQPHREFLTGVMYDDEEDDFHARTERAIAFAQPHPNAEKSSGYKDVQVFKFSERIVQNKVVKAVLWLYIRPADGHSSSKASLGSSDDDVVIINITRVTRDTDMEAPTLQPVRTTKVQPRRKGGWVNLDVGKLVAEWFRRPSDTMGIVIRVSDKHGRRIAFSDPSDESDAFQPFVEVSLQDGRKQRSKRTIGLNCNESSQETRCCRYPLTVDFEEFGWDWIIAPKKYEANYCSGECPYVFLQKYPHTHIVQQANPSGTAGPCCAPRKMSPISMLYFNTENNIIFGLLPGMVVDRCGCS